MKLISPSFSSFSSCSPSSSTPAFDATMCNSKSATAGCLAGILRRILCYGSFPTYPSDQIIGGEEQEANSVESCKDQHFKAKKKTEETEEKPDSKATPSLVARLMGLESIPDMNLVNTQTTQNSISRSKSMDSLDRLARGDRMQAQCRRVKSTRSFREMPTFLELENEDFFILSFESERKRKDSKRSKGRKCEKGYGEVKHRRTGTRKNNESRTEREAEAEAEEKKKQVQEGMRRRGLKDLNGREMVRSTSTNNSIPTKTIKKKETICEVLKNVESECSSEDLSPVSVLDCGQFLVDLEVPTSEEDSDLASPCKENGLASDEGKTKTREGKCLGSRKKEFQTAKHIEMWGEIFRLTEADLVGSNWIIQKGIFNHEASARIAADFESQILGQLLDELLVDQFADFPMKIQNL